MKSNKYVKLFFGKSRTIFHLCWSIWEIILQLGLTRIFIFNFLDMPELILHTLFILQHFVICRLCANYILYWWMQVHVSVIIFSNELTIPPTHPKNMTEIIYWKCSRNLNINKCPQYKIMWDCQLLLKSDKDLI